MKKTVIYFLNHIRYLIPGILLLFILLSANHLQAQTLAFPTAEGYGKYTTGGRGGAVYEVTTLNATGPGSLGAAISASGARTVVFRVAGTITGNFNISNGNITIAGQTAPGDGICIKGNLTTAADNIIIRYIRVRYNPDQPGDAIGGRYRNNIIIDHVSASWSADEVFTLYHNSNTTVQWCIIAEGCEKFENGVSVGHRFGGIWGNNYGTWHHNLIAHNDSRNPRWASGCGYNDYRNNVIYNWGYESAYGAEKQQPGNPNFSSAVINMIANYYKPGPATSAMRIANPSARSSTDKGDWYVAGNFFAGRSDITSNNWIGVVGSNYNQLSSPWNAMAINQQSPQDAYLAVLDDAGSSFPKRDKVDADIIDDVRTGTAKYGNNGIISKPSDVGGWPVLAGGTPPADSDHDGMPDSWELSHGLNPNNAADRNSIGVGGYTMLEIYTNGLVDAPPCTPAPVSGVSLSPTTATVGIGATTQLTATVAPVCAGNQNVSWASSNPSVATVNSYGMVTGVAVGSAIITVTTQDGGKTATSAVTVDNSVTYEAENYTAQSGSAVATAFGGFTGTGYIDMGDNGTWFEWNNIAGGGSATLVFRYANGSAANRQVGISVNGTTIGNLTMAPTGNWTTWATQTITASLNSGNNTIRVTVNTGNGGPNLDNVRVTGSSTTPALSVSPTSVSVAAAASSTGTFSVASNTNWTVSSNQSWLTVSPASGSNNGTVMVTAAENTATSTRSATVTVAASGVTSKTVMVTQAAAGGNGSSVTYEAENYTTQSGNSVQTSYSGYTGTGYVDMGNNGAWFEWNNVAGGGSATLVFRYANGSTVNRQVGISVNGTTIGNLTMAPTGNWATWATQTITASLNSGNNTIRVTVNTGNGGPNLDNVNVILNSGTRFATVLAENSLENNNNEDAKVSFYPNPSDKLLNITFGKVLTETANVYVLEATTGRVMISAKANGSSHTLDMSDLPKGIYIIKISNNKLKVVKRIVKQ